MANFLSEKQQYNKIIDPVNINLVNTVLSAKQGKFDQGVAAIDSALGELGRIDGMLLRDKDREYLANNVKSLLDVVNNSGKLDLSKSGVTRNIQSQIKSALDSTVINAVAQSSKIRTFQSEIADKQKNKPELYSDDNYQYALKNAGVQSYLNGETEEVGTLRYDDYIDAQKVLDESVAKWAKDFGYKTEFKSGDTSQLIYANEEKKVLSKNDIINKLKTSLDPKISKQLQINSDAYYSKRPEGQILTDATNYYNKQNSEIDVKLLGIKAEKTSASTSRKVELENDEKYYTDLKKENSKKLEDKDFDNIYQKYEIYTTNLFDNIADNYDRDEVVDIKYNDSNLKIAQFNSDIEYKQATLRQGQERIDIAKQQARAADTANMIVSGGSITDTPDQTAGEKTNSQKALEKHNSDFNELKAVLEASDENFRDLNTEQQKEDYIKNLASVKGSVSINNDSLNPEAREKLEVYKNSLNVIKSTRQNIANKVGNSIIENYNNLLGSSTNFSNLAKTAPLAANAASKGVPLTKLPKADVAAIKHEIAVNSLNFDGTLSPEERSTLKTYVRNLEQQPYLTPAQSKAMRSKDKDEVGYFAGTGDLISGTLKAWGSSLVYGGERFINSVTNNSSKNVQAEQDYKNRNKTIVNQLNRGWDRMEKSRLDKDITSEDTNYTELDTGDLKPTAKLGFSEAVKNAIRNATTNSEDSYKKIVQDTKNLRSISFNPENKSQAGITQAIKTQLSAVSETPVEIEKGSIFETVLASDGKNINITYIPKGETEKVVRTIPAESLPVLSQDLTDKSVPFINSKLNRNAPPRRLTYETPRDSKSREDLLYNIYNMYGEQILPQKELIKQVQTGQDIPTQIEMRAIAEKTPPEVATQINKLAEEVFDVIWTPTGSGWRATAVDSNNNPITLEGRQVEKVIPRDYNEGAMKLEAMGLINQYKVLKIKQLITE
jgi:hypothetical protein